MNKGILLLEGGAFRGLYTGGVLDVLMENQIWLDVAGVSAGALMGLNYISRQPGRSRQLNLGYRHDERYVGLRALKDERRIVGLDYLFNEMGDEWPFDEETFFQSPLKYYAVATNCETGAAEIFDRDAMGKEIYTAAMASASLPGMSEPVRIGSYTYLDGGASVAIPLWWAVNQGYEKIVVVRTRDRTYRKPATSQTDKLMFHTRFATKPVLRAGLLSMNERYNLLMEDLLRLEEEGRIFTLAPEQPVTVGRLEGDLGKLQQLYQIGRDETEARLDDLRAYLTE